MLVGATDSAMLQVLMNRTHYATTAELASVAHRLDALEAALIKNGSIIPADIDQYVRSTMSMYPTEDFPASSTGGASGANNAAAAAAARRRGDPAMDIDNGHNVPPKIDDDTEDAALTIEHLTFGRSRVAGGHSIPYFGARHPSSVGRKEPNNDYHLARTAHSSPGGQHPPPLHPHPHPHPQHAGSPSSQPQSAKRSSLNVEAKLELPHANRYVDSLSHEERMARMDALLDIMEPTDLIDMFWRKTDVGVRYLMRIFPSPEKGRFLVNAVSFLLAL